MQEIILPHKAPLRFAKYLLVKRDKYAEVALEFPEVPTSGMMLEGAAQSSAAFARKNQKIGFIVNFKNIEFYADASKKEMMTTIMQSFENNESLLVLFEIKELDETLVKGEILIVFQDVEQKKVQS